MIPKLTAEEIEKYALTPGEIKLIESQPGVSYEIFHDDWVEGQLPLERIRALDINAILAQRALREITARNIEPEFIGIRIGFFVKAGGAEWEITL